MIKKSSEVLYIEKNLKQFLNTLFWPLIIGSAILFSTNLFYTLFSMIYIVYKRMTHEHKVITDHLNNLNDRQFVERDKMSANWFKSFSGESYYDIRYYGKTEILNRVIHEITLKTHLINTLPKEVCKKLFRSEDMHYFFIGPPGTGKTYFIQKLMFEINKRLMIIDKQMKEEQRYQDAIRNGIEQKYLTKQETIKKKNALLDEYYIKTGKLRNILTDTPFTEINDWPTYINERYDRLFYKHETYSQLFKLKPSDLRKSKFGQSELSVKKIFDEILVFRNNVKANIVLFDESDSFFSARNEIIDGHSSNIGILSEFLAQFNRLNDEFKPVFMIAITNVYGNIDPAIKRRFSNLEFFLHPNNKERLDIILDLFGHFRLDEKTLKNMVDSTPHISHQTLISTVNSCIIDDPVLNTRKFNFKSFCDKIKKQKDILDEVYKNVPQIVRDGEKETDVNIDWSTYTSNIKNFYPVEMINS